MSLNYSSEEAVLVGVPYAFIKDMSDFYDETIHKLEELGVAKEELITESTFKFLQNFDFTIRVEKNFNPTKIPSNPFKLKDTSKLSSSDQKILFSLKHPINEIFGSSIMDESEELSKLMLEMSSKITFSENSIFISYINPDDLEKFQSLFTSEDPNIRKFALTVSLLNFFIKNMESKIEKSIISYARTNKQICTSSIKDEKGNEVWGVKNGHENFPQHLLGDDHPVLSTFLITNAKVLESPDHSLIPSYGYCQEIKNATPSNWQEEAITSYQTSLEVISLLSKLFHKDTLEDINKYIISTKSLHNTMKVVEGFYAAKGIQKTYPQKLKDYPAETLEEFLFLLKMSDFSEIENSKNNDTLEQNNDLSRNLSSKQKAKQKKKNKKKPTESPHQNDPTIETKEPSTTIPITLAMIWKKTSELTQDIKLAPRVEAWFQSIEQGLLTRSSEADKRFSEQEIILTHKLPAEVLHLCFHEEYSRIRSLDDRPDYTFRLSLVKINQKMHMVEMIMDETNCIYHFFARPMRNLSDYFTISDIANEFPSLDLKHENEKLSTNNIANLKSNNNIEVTFDGNIYEVIHLAVNN